MTRKTRAGILTLLAVSLCLAARFAVAETGSVGSTVLVEARYSDTGFVFSACDVLDEKFYDPKSLDYPKLFNASLNGVAEFLKEKGVLFATEQIQSGISESQAKNQFSAQFLKAKALASNLNLSRDDLPFLAVGGLLEAVDDSHTRFLPTKYFQETNKVLQGKNDFAGIGLTIRRLVTETGTLFYVGDVFPGSPAEQAGLRSFDIFAQVNGQSAPKENINQLVEGIRGPVGTEVQLLIKRKGELKSFKVKRARIFPPAMIAQSLRLENHRVDYLKTYGFQAGFKEEFTDYLISNVDRGNPDGLVIDLRHNPGGQLQLVDLVLDFVLPEKTPTYTLKDANQKLNAQSKMIMGVSQLKCPMVVLIDGGSASGSEIFSAVLQENNRATIVGEKSAGMVSVAEIRPLDRGSGMYVTIFAFFTAKGKKLEKVGVLPDVVVKFQEAEILRGKDNQLEAAYDQLKKLMK